MWRNYLILIIRKYRFWQGLALVNLLVLIIAYSLMAQLFNYLWFGHNALLWTVFIVSLIVIGIIYMNFISWQLQPRAREVFIRKLLGANNRHLLTQLLTESLVQTTFMVVAGMVVAEFFYPLCSRVLGLPSANILSVLSQQLLFVALLVVPIGVLAAYFPVRSFIRSINRDFGRSTKF